MHGSIMPYIYIRCKHIQIPINRRVLGVFGGHSGVYGAGGQKWGLEWVWGRGLGSSVKDEEKLQPWLENPHFFIDALLIMHWCILNIPLEALRYISPNDFCW